MWQCSQHHDNREEAKFCAKCGEKRVERVTCSACSTVLEPDDLFCTSCGQKRGEPAPPPAPAPVPTPPIAAEPEPPPPAPPEEPKAEPKPAAKVEPKESFSFQFAGMTIESADAEAKPDPKKSAKPPTSGKNPLVSAVLSFVLIAAVLGAAFYFITR